MRLDQAIDRYYVIGNSVQHSLSPEIHGQFAQQTCQAISYERLLVDADDFLPTLDRLSKELSGANITVPFKQCAFQYAQQLTPRAQLAGAVNTLKWLKNGVCLGDNTDGAGLITDILHNLQWSLTDSRILLLGAGGAARGIIKPLLDHKPNLLIVANRTIAKAQQLATEFLPYGPIQAHVGSLATIENKSFDLIINATASAINHISLPLNSNLISRQTRCYDLFYSAKPTDFMNWAIDCGSCQVANGLGMLVEQAAESFYFWRGIKPETAAVLKSLRTNVLPDKCCASSGMTESFFLF